MKKIIDALRVIEKVAFGVTPTYARGQILDAVIFAFAAIAEEERKPPVISIDAVKLQAYTDDEVLGMAIYDNQLVVSTSGGVWMLDTADKQFKPVMFEGRKVH